MSAKENHHQLVAEINAENTRENLAFSIMASRASLDRDTPVSFKMATTIFLTSSGPMYPVCLKSYSSNAKSIFFSIGVLGWNILSVWTNSSNSMTPFLFSSKRSSTLSSIMFSLVFVLKSAS
nr:hypothetical protein Iba_chr03bCG18430 [Ipomoea batatas]